MLSAHDMQWSQVLQSASAEVVVPREEASQWIGQTVLPLVSHDAFQLSRDDTARRLDVSRWPRGRPAAERWRPDADNASLCRWPWQPPAASLPAEAAAGVMVSSYMMSFIMHVQWTMCYAVTVSCLDLAWMLRIYINAGMTKVLGLSKAICRCIQYRLRRDFDRSRFGLVRNRSDFDSSGSVNRKRVYGSVCDQSEPRSWAGSVWFNMADVYMRK